MPNPSEIERQTPEPITMYIVPQTPQVCKICGVVFRGYHNDHCTSRECIATDRLRRKLEERRRRGQTQIKD